MAQTKLYAPEGHHFMVNKKGGFYLMKNPSTGYKYHKFPNGEASALYILVDVKNYHATGSAIKSKGAIYNDSVIATGSNTTPSSSTSRATTSRATTSRSTSPRTNSSRSTY